MDNETTIKDRLEEIRDDVDDLMITTVDDLEGKIEDVVDSINILIKELK